MEGRKKRIKSTKKIRNTKSITRNIIRSDLPLLIHLIHSRVRMKVRSPIANAIIDQEAETVIIGHGQGLMRKDTEEMTHVKERIGIILVKGEETPEKEMSKLSPNNLVISDQI